MIPMKNIYNKWSLWKIFFPKDPYGNIYTQWWPCRIFIANHPNVKNLVIDRDQQQPLHNKFILTTPSSWSIRSEQRITVLLPNQGTTNARNFENKSSYIHPALRNFIKKLKLSKPWRERTRSKLNDIIGYIMIFISTKYWKLTNHTQSTNNPLNFKWWNYL